MRERTAILNTTTPLDFERYLPTRVGLLADALGAALAGACARRFEITLTEWRVLNVVAARPGLSAAQVAKHAGMDKVAVSRAVATLARARRVERLREDSDRRCAFLRLTPRGCALHEELVAWALAYEQALLRGMKARNRAKLDQLLGVLLQRVHDVRAERVMAPKPREK